MKRATSERRDGDTATPVPSRAPHGVEVAALETSDLALRPTADGTIATAQRVLVRQLRARTHAGAIDAQSAALSGMVARLSAAAPARTLDVLELSADELRIDGMNAIIHEMPPPSPQAAAVRVDALSGLDGVIRAFVTDALWIIDAEIVIPIVQGRIDFSRVIVEHIGPNSSMSVGASGIHIDAPHRARVDVFAFDAPSVPGISAQTPGASRTRTRERGRLDVAPFVQALLASAGGRPLARVADSRLDGAIERTRLAGDVQMGDGEIGTATHRIALTGREKGNNRIELSAVAVGQRLIARMPKLAADSATFALADAVFTAARVTATVDVHLIGLRRKQTDGAGATAIAIVVKEATLERLRMTRRDPG